MIYLDQKKKKETNNKKKTKTFDQLPKRKNQLATTFKRNQHQTEASKEQMTGYTW